VEEVVLSALAQGFDAIGFSGHGFTEFDYTYCMMDMDAYLAEVRRVQEKYKNDIEVYAGVEEDAACPMTRGKFDYIIGSSHYFHVDHVYYPVDSNYECMQKCIEVYGGNALRMAEDYYSAFCTYINAYRPDIIGHFDLLTKFDEQHPFFLANPAYTAIASRYVREAAKSGSVFEVNTGAISRGYRTTPYPHVDLLHVLKTEGARVMLTSDSHRADTIACAFDEARALLREVGFRSVTHLYHGAFVAEAI
jgi:histidinol-phosphatase (PHP family)